MHSLSSSRRLVFDPGEDLSGQRENLAFLTTSAPWAGTGAGARAPPFGHIYNWRPANHLRPRPRPSVAMFRPTHTSDCRIDEETMARGRAMRRSDVIIVMYSVVYHLSSDLKVTCESRVDGEGKLAQLKCGAFHVLPDSGIYTTEYARAGVPS